MYNETETLEAPKMTEKNWFKVANTNDFPLNVGSTIRYNGYQIAVFNFHDKTEWYAVQNLCPHEKQMVLARGIAGDTKGEKKITCALHKRSFSLKSGKSFASDCGNINTYEVKIEDGWLFVDVSKLDALN